jgi:4'-phosphopantetheinyl transferase
VQDLLSLVAAGKWTRPLSVPEALATRAQVWLVPLDTPDFLGLAQPLLSPEEQSRAGRFAREQLRRRFILSHAALRCILSLTSHGEPGQLRLDSTSKGKPFLVPPNPADVRFNLSHSGDLALIAVTHHLEVGVDLEWETQRRGDLLEIAQRYFAPAEREALAHVPSTEHRRTFFRAWTRKEAVLKASGHGISAGFQAPDVSAGLLGDLAVALPIQYGGIQWLLFDLELQPDYAGALALENPGATSQSSFEHARLES